MNGLIMESFTPTTKLSTEAHDLKDVYRNTEMKKKADILTNDQRLIFEAIFFVAFCGIVGFLGMAANVINIVIFCKQGFTNTVNIAFLGLAISDFFCLLFLVWASICMNPLVQIMGAKWVGEDILYVTAGWPHICFGRITSFITVYITGERCLSIAFPLRIKEIVTKTKTTVIIILIYFLNLMSMVPESATTYLGWRFVPERNMTMLSVRFTSSRKSVEGICFVIHTMISAASFFGVVIFTIILVIKLRQSSVLRNEMTSGDDHKGSMSARDKKAVKMIVLIASILIACYTPGAMIAMTAFAVGPEFNIQGRYINICTAVWSIALSCQSINSSVNIFLYYRMSSKFRQTFDEIFSIFKRK